MIPEADGGPNTLDNAIVLCFDCHAEVGHYNPRHPRGTKYSPAELRQHRDLWWEWYSKNSNAPMPNEAISVTPSAVMLWTGAWKHSAIVKVYNRTNEIYYKVPVIFTITQPRIPLNAVDINLIMPKEHDVFPADENGVQMALDIGLGMTDMEGRAIKIYYLGSLGPKEIRTFIVRHSVPQQVAMFTQAKLLIEIGKFSREPLEMIDMP